MTTNAVIIEQYEAILSGSRNFNEEEDNRTILTAYRTSKKTGNLRIDFNDIIWNDDIKPIADTMRRNGIEAFTISVHQGNLFDVLVAFQELGIFVKGIVPVKVSYKEQEVSAILMQVA